MPKLKGFSLIELLIVVAIILIIAAIAIPNLLRARISANESAAVSSIRTIGTAEVTYQTIYPATGYAAALTNLGGAQPCVPAVANACLIDDVLAQNGTPAGTGKSGYNFSATGDVSTFFVTAVPIAVNKTGNRSFCGVADAVLRFNSSGAAIGNAAACLALNAIN